MLRKEKTLTETNVLYLRWLFSRHATDANVKVLLNEYENSNKDLAMDLNLCIHLQPLKLTLLKLAVIQEFSYIDSVYNLENHGRSSAKCQSPSHNS